MNAIPSGSSRRGIFRLVAAAALTVAALSFPAEVGAQSQEDSQGPSDWDVNVGSLPVSIRASVPPALPIDVAAGAGFSGVKIASVPFGLATAGPVYAPVVDALGLLGGTGALVPIAVQLVPSLLLGAGTIFGLPPLPIDPGVFPSVPLPALPSPDLPIVQCSAEFPGDPREVTCGGPQQGLMGYRLSASSGTASITGDPSDTDTVDARSASRVAEMTNDEGFTFLPMSVGGSKASSRVQVVGEAIEASTAFAVSDVDILDGLVTIGSVRSGVAATLTGRPNEQALDRTVCNIVDMRVAGVPVEVGTDGITVVDTAADNPVAGLVGDLASGLGELAGQTLDALSLPMDVGRLDIRALPLNEPRIGDDGATLETSVACLEIVYTIEASASSVAVTVGQASVKMSAYRQDRGIDGDASSDGVVSPGGFEEPTQPVAAPPVAGGTGSPRPRPVQPRLIEPGEGAPPPSNVGVVRPILARAPDWLPVLIAVFLLSCATPILVRSRRAVWQEI